MQIKAKKLKIIFVVTLSLSILSSIYLHEQLANSQEDHTDIVMESYGTPMNERIVFPEVEVIKVVIEKLIEIVTISKA